MSPQEKHLESLVATYITGQLFKNQLSCLRKYYDGPDKNERYLQNKYREMDKTMDILFKPMDLELKRSGTYDELENLVIQYHEFIDKLLSFDRERFDKAVEAINSI